MVAIITADGKTFDISESVANQIAMIKNAAEEFSDEIIPIPTVNSSIFEKIIDFYTFRTEEHDIVTTEEFNTSFFDMPTDILFDIISAANFLNASDLLDSACSAAANLIRDKNPDEIRKILNVENNFTPEEEAAVIEENKWAFQPKITYHHRG